MEFSDAEKQVLIAIKMRSRKETPNRGWLDEHMELLFDKELLDWKPALASLMESGSVRESAEGLNLADEIEEQVGRLHKEWSADSFSDWMLKSEESAAYSTFCKRLYGKDLCQCNMMNMAQLEKFLDVLSLGPENQVLDLGCGIGTISEYISDHSGARITGIDFAARAIERAQERTSKKRDRLIFQAYDMNDLQFPANSFDTIIAIDTLYFVGDLCRTVALCKEIVMPGGQMGAFYTQVVSPKESRDILQADRTKFAQALAENQLEYRTWNYNEDERRHWQVSKDIAEDLKAQFEQEGNFELYDGRIKESEQLLKAVNDDRISRYLYHVRV